MELYDKKKNLKELIEISKNDKEKAILSEKITEVNDMIKKLDNIDILIEEIEIEESIKHFAKEGYKIEEIDPFSSGLKRIIDKDNYIAIFNIDGDRYPLTDKEPIIISYYNKETVILTDNKPSFNEFIELLTNLNKDLKNS